MKPTQEAQLQLFLTDYFQSDNFQIIPLQQSGSARMNFVVIHNNQKYILTYNSKIDENESFFYLTESFRALDLNVPKIFKINEDRTLYLQEFLGENTFSEIIAVEGHNDRVKSLVKQTVEKLSTFQHKTNGKIDFSNAYEYEEYDQLPITHDLYYFKNFFVDVLEVDYHKGKLLKEFQQIVDRITSLEPKAVMIRDFQARNIMVNDKDEVYFIDYQAAMLGPATYDLVSFLFQAKANFPTAWQDEFLEMYFQLNSDRISQEEFDKSIAYCKLMRFLQVLGAYGFRGLIQHKKHFLESIPRGIENITELTKTWSEMQNYPELTKIIGELETSYRKFK